MTDKRQDQSEKDDQASQNKGFKMRGDKPKPTQVNKPLVWGVGIVVLLIIVVIFVEALSPREQQQDKASINHSSPAKTGGSGGGVSKLPGSYSDSSIKKYLPDQQNKQLKQQLQNLQSSQSSLKRQLEQLQQEKSQQHQPRHRQSPEKKQAIMSGLYFPGGNPSKQKNQQGSQNSSKTQSSKKGSGKGSGGSESDYEKQNMQQEKINFLKDSSDQDQGDIYNKHGVVKPVSPYEIQAGSILPATLMTAINTSLPGKAVAIVRRDIYDSVHGQHLLIPKGSKIIGQYLSQVSYGQTRVLIKFKRIIRPNGSSILINNAPGADLFGQAGMKGSVDNHWSRILGASVLSTTLSLGAGAVAQGARNSGQEYPSSTENAVNSAGSNVSQIGQKITDRAMNIQPTIKLPAGYEFNIIVNKDMILPPMGQGGETR